MAETGRSPLYQKRVLITRAKEQSENLVQQLLAVDALPICAPLIRFAPVEDSRPLDLALRNLDRFDWLFLTSQNALRFVLERAEFLGISLTEASRTMRVAAVAPVTAAAAQKAGLHVGYTSKKHQGSGLAEELGPQLEGRRVFLPRSDKANRELPGALRKAGAEVEEVIAYRTLGTQAGELQLRDIVRRCEIDAIVFFSPSAVHHFADSLGSEQIRMLRDRTAFVAIGPVTAEALAQAGVEQVLQANDTDTAAVIEALTQAFDSRRPGTSAGVKRG